MASNLALEEVMFREVNVPTQHVSIIVSGLLLMLFAVDVFALL